MPLKLFFGFLLTDLLSSEFVFIVLFIWVVFIVSYAVVIPPTVFKYETAVAGVIRSFDMCIPSCEYLASTPL